MEKQFLITDQKTLKENKTLKQENEKLDEMYNEAYKLYKYNQKLVKDFDYLNDIFIRYHNNTSRLIRSLLQLWKEQKNLWLWEFCNNVLDECVTTLIKDRADKSSSIYFVNGNELEMYVYNRIEFSSSRERRFKRDEGFAGSIWSKGEPDIVQDVSADERFSGDFAPSHEYGSILGYPIKIGKDIVGVLCIQSEAKNGFEQDDCIIVNFYAAICGLAKQCDIISRERRASNGS